MIFSLLSINTVNRCISVAILNVPFMDCLYWSRVSYMLLCNNSIYRLYFI